MPKHKKYELHWPEWTLLAIVGIAVVAVTTATIKGVTYDPDKDAEKELQMLADDYYTLYLYPRLLGKNQSPEKALSIYQENGVPTVYLRQLLQYNNGEHAASAPVFKNLECNTNVTGVRYYPYAPYGPRDYTVKQLWHCEKKQNQD